LVTNTFIATDLCGNATTNQQVITVRDTIRPEDTTAPADSTVECLGDVPALAALIATAADNCGTLTVSSNRTQGGTCPTLVTNTFIATDLCGNATTNQQVITVRDTIAPVFTSVPADSTVECLGDVPALAALIATAADNCGTLTVSSNRTQGGTCPTLVTNTFIATDLCGNATTNQQVITVRDTIAPVFTSVPADSTVECIGDVPALATLIATATDNCGTLTVSSNRTQGGTCPTLVTNTFIATDLCGNATTNQQVITVDRKSVV